jgi:hypothetical protein
MAQYGRILDFPGVDNPTFRMESQTYITQYTVESLWDRKGSHPPLQLYYVLGGWKRNREIAGKWKFKHDYYKHKYTTIWKL